MKMFFLTVTAFLLVSPTFGYPDGVPIVNMSSCSEEDFVGNDSCTLMCTQSFTNTSISDISDMEIWFSYCNNQAYCVTVHGFKLNNTEEDDEYNYTVSVELFTYNAGIYQCNFFYYNHTDQSEHTSTFAFQISQQGKNMNETCEEASECLALNAQCDDYLSSDGTNQCNCNGLYNITCNNGPTNPACLKHEDPGQFCNTNEECIILMQAYSCLPTKEYPDIPICQCSGYYTNVTEEDGILMCMAMLYLTSPCIYDEQCVNSNNGPMICKDNMCNCAPGYALSSDLSRCYETPFDLEIESCFSGNFTDNSSCTLGCSIDYSDYDDYIFCDSQWLYKGEEMELTVIIFDGVTKTDDTNKVATTLELLTYNGGYYYCQFNFTQSSNSSELTVVNVFQIDPLVEKVGMNNPCDNSTQCMALNAVCDEVSGICVCPPDYSIPFDVYTYNSACLAPQPLNGSCNIDAECSRPNEDIDCHNYECTCEGKLICVAEENETRCLDPVDLTMPCAYNEQCQMNDVNSLCNASSCDCIENYFVTFNYSSNPSDYFCTNLTTGLLCKDYVEDDFSLGYPSYAWCALNTSFYKINTYQWIYTTGDQNPNDYYIFQSDEVSETVTGNVFNVSLKLKEENGGFYTLLINATDSDESAVDFNHTFRISSGPFIGIGEDCNGEPCATLNAVCTRTDDRDAPYCQCAYAYPVPFNSETYTPICLQAEEFNGSCMVDAQCQFGITVCEDGFCKCQSGYFLNEYGACNPIENPPDNNNSQLSGGAIAGIVIAVLFVCIVLGGIIYQVKKQRSGKD